MITGKLQGTAPLNAGDLAAGDVVEFHPVYTPKLAGQPHRVVRTMQKNVVLENEQGGELRADPFLLIRSTKPFVANEGPALVLGSLVRFKPRNAGRWGETLFVLCDNPKGGKVRLGKVGGDGGRWIAGVPLTALTVVDPAEVLD